MSACCPEPHHNPVTNARRHRLHHWKERAVCASICTVIHFALELFIL